ncbi:MAG: antitoxin YezG family protein [Conexibacteraceae bacterium]|nr:antitoxin YezG family protein [Conexibacteraceae bacterium]
MADPSSIPLVRQGELIKEIAQRIVGVVSGEWSVVRYEIETVTSLQQDLIYVTRPDGNEDREVAPEEVVDLDIELRSVMYKPGAGAWFSATIVVTNTGSDTGSLDAHFNYDDEPGWDYPVDPVVYLRDLERFPRDDSAIPDWLRQRLQEADAAQ